MRKCPNIVRGILPDSVVLQRPTQAESLPEFPTFTQAPAGVLAATWVLEVNTR